MSTAVAAVVTAAATAEGLSLCAFSCSLQVFKKNGTSTYYKIIPDVTSTVMLRRTT